MRSTNRADATKHFGIALSADKIMLYLVDQPLAVRIRLTVDIYSRHSRQAGIVFHAHGQLLRSPVVA